MFRPTLDFWSLTGSIDVDLARHVLTGRLHSESERSFSGLARKREVPVSRLIVQLMHFVQSTRHGRSTPHRPYGGGAEVWVDDISAAALFVSDQYNTVIAADE